MFRRNGRCWRTRPGKEQEAGGCSAALAEDVWEATQPGDRAEDTKPGVAGERGLAETGACEGFPAL